MSTGVIGVVTILMVMLVTIGMVWRRVLVPRRRRRAAAIYTSVQLQRLAYAAMATLLDEARASLARSEDRTTP